jgi:hypothetical protein
MHSANIAHNDNGEGSSTSGPLVQAGMLEYRKVQWTFLIMRARPQTMGEQQKDEM